LLIHGPKLQEILAAVGPRILAGDALAAAVRPEARAPGGQQRFAGGGYMADNGIAVQPVLGTLVRRGSQLDALSGMTSYAAIEAGVAEMLADRAVRGVMLEIDSFGGEAGGVFDLVRAIRRYASQAGKPIWAIANEAAASAGYAIATAASRIWLPEMGEVGSVGVVTAHVDQSGADAKAGLKWTYVFAGDHKVDGNPHEPLSVGVKAEIQADINKIYGLFANMVAQNRRMQVEVVRDTQARMFMGNDAIRVRLADRLGTIAEAMSTFAEHLNTPSAPRRTAVAQARSTPNMANSSDQFLPQAIAEDDAVADERSRVAELTRIDRQASELGVGFNIAEAIENGTTPEAARVAILERATERAKASRFVGAQPAAGAAAPSTERSRDLWGESIQRIAGSRRPQSRA
jgi:signal peptide peptidase SppA